MPDQLIWDYHFESELDRVRQTVRDILAKLDEWLPGQTPEDRSDFKLIFSELLYNAVIHGNHSDAKKHVHIQLRVSGPNVTASILDEGSGYNYRKAVEQIKKEDNFQKETGRGIRLVLSLADDVQFDRSGKRVTFTKRIGAHHG